MDELWSKEQEDVVQRINSSRQHALKPREVTLDNGVPLVLCRPSPIEMHDLCVPCSVSIVTDKPITDVCSELGRYMALTGWLPNRLFCFEPYLKDLGFVELVNSTSFTTLKGRTAHGIVEAFHGKEPTLLVVVSKHMYAIVNGCVVDNWDSRTKRAKFIYIHKDELARVLA